MKMTSNQPYLLRAFYDWIVDNDLTPHLVVDATVSGVQVPQEHVKDGQIVLNVSPSACAKLVINDFEVTFEARFNGAARSLVVPCAAVQAIYAKENGAGTLFTAEEIAAEQSDSEEIESSTTEIEPTKPEKKKPTLTIVK
jgi:stringent starvation protein B